MSVIFFENPIKNYMKEAGVEKVFIATDGVDGEREELKEEFGDSVYFYNPTPEEEKKFKKGGVAIIDQDGISKKNMGFIRAGMVLEGNL